MEQKGRLRKSNHVIVKDFYPVMASFFWDEKGHVTWDQHTYLYPLYHVL